jgi:hypothetical protein
VYRGKGKSFFFLGFLDQPTVATATLPLDANGDGE